MSSIRGRHPLIDTPRVIGTTDWVVDWDKDFSTGREYSPGRKPPKVDPPVPIYTPEPGGKCKRKTIIDLSGSYPFTAHPHGVTFIFVQGKESACIVTRDLGKDKNIHDLRLDFIGLADVRLVKASVIGHVFEQPAEMYPYAVVSALLNSDDLNEEKESKPSSHKASSSVSKKRKKGSSSSRPLAQRKSSRPLNEKAAINFLMHRLEDDGFKEPIQAAISALQLLYEENVEADEIKVYTAHVDNTKKFLSREEIEMHLASSST